MIHTILITGASSGIGKATAELFARDGWEVIGTMRKAEEYRTQFPQENVHLFSMDVADPTSITATVAQVKQQFGTIDVLVNNAGYGIYGAFETCSAEDIQKQYQVNVFGLMEMCRAVVPLMREQKNGTIVNIASMGGKFSLPFYSIYTSTKFAVEGFSEGLAYEVEPFGIRVKVVEPGVIHTGFYNRSRILGSDQKFQQLYASDMKQVWARYDQTGATGGSADMVAGVIKKAAESKSKRMRYVAGRDARMNVYAVKILPHTWLMDYVRRTILRR